jgi:DNA repair protein RecO (recombination protein O)
LALPAFLRGNATGIVTPEDMRAGLALTGHFLEARVLRPRDMQMPDGRARLQSYLRRNP